MENIHGCDQCVCFDVKKQRCKVRSLEDGNPFSHLYNLLNKLSGTTKFSNRKLRWKEVGFEWALSDGSLYVERPVSFNRKCSFGVIATKYLNIKDKRVLEIAPRYFRFLLPAQLKLNDCEYYSISGEIGELKRGNTQEIKKKPLKTPGDYYGFTSELSTLFQSDYFDVVLGSQCFEHWREEDPCEQNDQNAYQVGLDNCHQILKKGGLFMQDFPFNLHGDPLFISVNIEGIRQLFDPQKWENIEIIQWGKTFATKDWTGFVKAIKK